MRRVQKLQSERLVGTADTRRPAGVFMTQHDDPLEIPNNLPESL